MAKYTIKEDGKNGSVEIDSGDIVRTYNKRLGRDDEVRIPLRTVKSVDLDRQMGGDVVKVVTSDATFEWKLSDDDANMSAPQVREHLAR